MTKILFLVPYPLKQAPSQRFRFEQYFSALAQAKHEVRVQSFLSEKNWRTFYADGNHAQKITGLMEGFVKRAYSLLTLRRYDFVFIHREVAPLGPPIFEWMIATVWRKKIIYDFDDAIWTTDRRDEPALIKLLKWRKKTAAICRWAYTISAGNAYLYTYAARYNPHVVLNPTTLDTDLNRSEVAKKNDELVVGWTGSHSTLKYLKDVEPVLQAIEQQYAKVRFRIIADRNPELKLTRLDFVTWNRTTEVKDLAAIDIGIMPLPNDEWANGKCGFKALQYMALQIPAVASPVGVNTQIIKHEKNGLLASSYGEWRSALSQLIDNEPLRKTLGSEARKTVETAYSVAANTKNFLSLFSIHSG
jgi:glycosyltransferase involved in cell wall biosynthesis